MAHKNSWNLVTGKSKSCSSLMLSQMALSAKNSLSADAPLRIDL